MPINDYDSAALRMHMSGMTVLLQMFEFLREREAIAHSPDLP